jgi:hypothetical protein
VPNWSMVILDESVWFWGGGSAGGLLMRRPPPAGPTGPGPCAC